MAEAKTVENDASVDAFLHTIADERKREDSYEIIELMQDVSGFPPKMWGTAIIGFGKILYEGATAKGYMPLAAFSPRKQNLTLYISSGFEKYPHLLEKLGKHSTAKVCLYIKRLSDVNMDVLRELVQADVEYFRALHS
jgi:hypothetical protein